MEARAYIANSMQELSVEIRKAKDSGINLSQIERETGIKRPVLSNLVNHGAAGISDEGQKKLWDWIDQRNSEKESSVPASLRGAPAGGYLQQPAIIDTNSYKKALGWCADIAKTRRIGVLIGMPGTGKTTILRKIAELLPNAIYLEAWQSMRLGDLLEKLGRGAGLMLKGSLTKRIDDLIEALKGTNYVIIIDETEYLKKWNVEKLDVLRKIHDNTGCALIMAGTPALRNVLNRSDVTQLSRRMFELNLDGASIAEILKGLEQYDLTTDAAQELAKIAADTAHGGMGTYTLMLELCLMAANGGMITSEMVAEARRYKAGLR